MSIAIELPDEYESRVKSGETVFTYQLADEIKVGSTITLIAGGARRQVRITSKRWVPETRMSQQVHQKILTIAPPREKGFSGAFQMGFEYLDGDGPKPEERGKEVDEIAKGVEEEI